MCVSLNFLGHQVLCDPGNSVGRYTIVESLSLRCVPKESPLGDSDKGGVIGSPTWFPLNL